MLKDLIVGDVPAHEHEKSIRRLYQLRCLAEYYREPNNRHYDPFRVIEDTDNQMFRLQYHNPVKNELDRCCPNVAAYCDKFGEFFVKPPENVCVHPPNAAAQLLISLLFDYQFRYKTVDRTLHEPIWEIDERVNHTYDQRRISGEIPTNEKLLCGKPKTAIDELR